MKRKILLCFLAIFLLIIVTGCDKSSNNKENKTQATSDNYDVVGIWSLKNKINTSNPYQYSSLKTAFGDCLNLSTNALTLNKDNTFSLYVGCAYNMTGNYTLEDNIISFSNIKDDNITNENTLKEMEDNLKVEVIEYRDEILLQMKTNIDDYVDVYIYFGNSNNENYDDSSIPEMSFNVDNLTIGEYTLAYGLYTGTYQTTQTESMDNAYTVTVKIKINNDNTIAIYDDVFGDYVVYNYIINLSGKICFGTSCLEILEDNLLKYGDVELKYES